MTADPIHSPTGEQMVRWHDVLPRRGLVLAVHVAVYALALTLLVYDLPMVRPAYVFTPWVDGWVQGSCFSLAAVLCLLRAARRDEDAWLWGWIGLALTARALGFVSFLGYVRLQVPPVYPSIADAFWLLTPVLMMVGLVRLTRSRFGRVSTSMALDGIAAGLIAAAATLATLGPTLLSRSSGTPAVVLTNLAYPALDLVLLMVLAYVLSAYGWRPPLPIWGLVIGVLSFVVTDVTFLIQISSGTFRPGTMLTAFTVVTNAFIASAAFLPGRVGARRELLPGYLAPTVLGILALIVLAGGAFLDTMLRGTVLALLALFVLIGRAVISYRTVLEVAQRRREVGFDDLTDLPNRRTFHEELSTALLDRPPTRACALLIVDVDNFKGVNETLGHLDGDRVLRELADRIGGCLRDGDSLARMSADEFGLIVEGADAGLATEAAERVTLAVQPPFLVGGRTLEVTVSIGIAVFPADGQEAGELLQRADLAMYEAKAGRTGMSRYRPEPHQAKLARRESVDRLRRAIEDDEIVLHYQPVVSLMTGEITGFEALCRWQNPGLGLVPPGSFLPLAESGGLMRLLTLNVLAQSVRQAARWREEGHRLTVAVNLSVTNLVDVAFPDQLAMLLEAEGLPGSAVELELTEDLFMADPDRARGVIRDLRRLGVQLMVDDYGAGYSSLGYLRDLHEIAGLKIDRSFVTHLVDDPRASAIVESTLTLAGSLGLRVIAEGVETPAVRDRLAGLGCEYAQGFLFARPAPGKTIRFGGIGEARAEHP
ncbi:MAG: EAL domain-containing protein [Nocardioides sp.]